MVPALKKALETEEQNDIVTGCLIALAKIGDVKNEDGTSEFVYIIQSFLAAEEHEISERASALWTQTVQTATPIAHAAGAAIVQGAEELSGSLSARARQDPNLREGLDALSSGWASLRGWASAQSEVAQSTWQQAVAKASAAEAQQRGGL